MKRRFVILGNGIAGFSAAREIRRLGEEDEIWIVSGERYPAYRRPLLSKTCLKDLKREDIQIVEDSWYKEAHIRQLLGRQIARIEADEKQVRLSDGHTIGYDACIYALGAENVLPPFCRRDLPAVCVPSKAAQADRLAGEWTARKGIFTIRTMEDIRRLKKRLLLSEKAVVIGGGSIGLEIAWEMLQMGVQVTILEGGPWLMGRLLDGESAHMLAGHIEKKGISVYTNVQVESLTKEGAVTGVSLSDGRHLAADLVVVCCGTRAHVELAKEAKIACDKGVLVDDFMQTRRPDIYGAGDCIQWRGAVTGLWGFALASGRLAGYNAAVPREKRERLSYAPYPLLFNGMGISLSVMGDVQTGEGTHRAPKSGQQGRGGPDGQTLEGRVSESGRFLVDHHDGEDIRYEKYFYQDGQLTGAVLIGDLSRMEEIRQMLAARSIRDTRKRR